MVLSEIGEGGEVGDGQAAAPRLLTSTATTAKTACSGNVNILGNENPEEWHLPPRPKGMRWATYERRVARYDAAEDVLDVQLSLAAARLMKRL